MSTASIPFSSIAPPEQLHVIKIAPDTELPSDPLDLQADRWCWALTQAMDHRSRGRLDRVWHKLQHWGWLADPWSTLVFSITRYDGVFGLELPGFDDWGGATIVYYRNRMWRRDRRGVLTDLNFPGASAKGGFRG